MPEPITPETWAPVPGYRGRYEVSDLGRVRSLFANYARRRPTPLVLKPEPGHKGHLRVTLSLDRSTKRFLVHRLVLAAFVGPCPDGQEACHFDDEAGNNRLGNLRWDTRKANSADAQRNGRMPHKSIYGDRLEDCRRMIAAGSSLRSIARKMGVSSTTISTDSRINPNHRGS